MDIFIAIGLILVILGVIGSIVPALPGPVLGFLGLVFLFIAKGAESVAISTLVLFGLGVVILTLIDYVAPIMGAKYFGASRKGIWGAIIGAGLGIIFFPPLGIFLGALLGAILGESYGGKKLDEAVRAGVGVVVGSISVIVLQTIFSIGMAVYFFVKAF